MKGKKRKTRGIDERKKRMDLKDSAVSLKEVS